MKLMHIDEKRAGRESGQAIAEFLIVILMVMMMILAVVQLTMAFNAQSMVRLAAFNAARASIVARGDNPEDPVSFDDMKDEAKKAAFITLLPVIPALHGALPTSYGELPGAVTDILRGVADNPEGALGTVVDLAIEYFMIDVRYYEPDTNTEITSFENRIEFDDPSRQRANLIRVGVRWQYPLVVPFINRILVASLRPELYVALRTVQTGDPVKAVADQLQKPAWELANAFDVLEGALDNEIGGFAIRKLWNRVPVSASYVMRMQWDRGDS